MLQNLYSVMCLTLLSVPIWMKNTTKSCICHIKVQLLTTVPYSPCCGRLSEMRTPYSPTRRRSDSTTSMATRRLLPAQGTVWTVFVSFTHPSTYHRYLFYGCISFMQCRADPDPAFQVNSESDTDPDPGFWWSKTERKKNIAKIFKIFFGLKLQFTGETFSRQREHPAL